MKMTALKFFALAGALGTTAPGLAQTNSPAVSGPRIAFAAPDYNFGTVDSGTLVNHDYVFTNTGDQTLEVTGVNPSCGCTTAGNWDKRVAPGLTGKIPIEFNSAGYGGAVHKVVFVTCNDPAQTNVILNLQGTIWKQFDISPKYAVFNLMPDSHSNQTRTIWIINNGDEPVTVSDPANGNPAFRLALQTVQKGKEFELHITAVGSNISGSAVAPITLKTSSPKMPVISLMAFAMTQPLFVANPPRIMLPSGPLPQAAKFTVAIQYNGTHPMSLSQPEINAPGAEAQLSEWQPGRQFDLTVSFPSGFQSQPGQKLQATIKTDLAKYSLITIPVFQRPASALAADRSATASAAPTGFQK